MRKMGITLTKVKIKRFILVTAASFMMVFLMSMWPDLLSSGEVQDSVSQAEVTSSLRGQEFDDFTELARKVSPAVINISTIRVGDAGPLFRAPFGEGDPFSEFWKRFFGAPLPYRDPLRPRGFGSGFIIDPEGFILTNQHVVENAGKIVVKLSDKRELEARLIGADPKTDIALIKIDAKGRLPTAPLGDSSMIEVGEWVLAIGNPFGLDHTVTSGIVSAKGRNIGAGPYDNFIQTDASINPGNSGGPLVNMEGEVVGINTAILSRSGGNIGIGFAIPINLVKELLPQLKEKGVVVRAWLGVAIQRVSPAIAESLGLEGARGALVASVSKGGPAECGGVKVGDVITEFDEKAIKDSDDLPRMVASMPVGKEVQLKVIRDKKEVALTVTIGEQKGEEVVASAKGEKNLGLKVQKLTPEVAANLGLDRAEGVIITSVKPGSPGWEGGLRRGDVILEIDRKPIRNFSDYQKVVADIKKGKGVLLLVRRGGISIFLVLKVPEGGPS